MEQAEQIASHRTNFCAAITFSTDLRHNYIHFYFVISLRDVTILDQLNKTNKFH